MKILAALLVCSIIQLVWMPLPAGADGKVIPPVNYKGSLEEKAQEAIIVFTAGRAEKSSVQDMILKIQVAGKVDDFAWVVPLPTKPETREEDANLFRECFDYVEYRLRPRTEGRARVGQRSLDVPLLYR